MTHHFLLWEEDQNEKRHNLIASNMGGLRGLGVWGVGTGTLSNMKMIDVRGWSFFLGAGLVAGCV